jgi:ATP-dependent Clp protease ATP-binding subunit ClpB
MSALRSKFRPEFLNRVDEIIFFKPLRMEEITEIVKLLLKQLEERLKERNITLEVTPEALNIAAKNGYDPVYGARPLKRYLQKRLETQIARLIISGEAEEGSVIRVENQGNDLVIHVE